VNAKSGYCTLQAGSRSQSKPIEQKAQLRYTVFAKVTTEDAPMKKLTLLPFSLFLAALLFPPSAHSTCTVASLKGPYEVTVTGIGNPGRSGSSTGNNSQVNSAGVGVVNFDGMGNVTLRYTFAEGGFVSTSTLATPDIGTYTVHADCTAIIYDTTIAAQYNMVLIGGGTEMFGDAGFSQLSQVKPFEGHFSELRRGHPPARSNGKSA
jgi:hypothetical protein